MRCVIACGAASLDRAPLESRYRTGLAARFAGTWCLRAAKVALSHSPRVRVAPRAEMVATALVASAALLASGGSGGAVCFGPSEQSIVPVYEQAPPPRFDGQSDYKFYPITVAASAQLDKLRDKRSSVAVAFWQWSNHGPRSTDGGYKGNITPGSKDVQIRFSSIEAADDCTMAQTSALLGVDPKSDLEHGHLRPTTESQTVDTLDVCILPGTTLPEGGAVVLDFEVQDDRTAPQTRAFLEKWAALVKNRGHETVLYPNALDAPSQKRTNLPPVAANVAAKFDKVFALLWSKNAQGDIARSFERQAEIYRVPASKLLIAFELAGTTQADARAVHGILASGKASGITFWRNHAEQGGACDSDVNRKIACLAFGRC